MFCKLILCSIQHLKLDPTTRPTCNQPSLQLSRADLQLEQTQGLEQCINTSRRMGYRSCQHAQKLSLPLCKCGNKPTSKCPSISTCLQFQHRVHFLRVSLLRIQHLRAAQLNFTWISLNFSSPDSPVRQRCSVLTSTV